MENKMTQFPRISIVIPCFNSRESIERPINSLNKQVFKNFEVIFVEDGSKEKLTKEQLNTCDFKYEYFSLGKNHGVSAARNVGIGLSRGTYVFFLDSDDAIPVNALDILCKRSGNFEYDLVVGNLAMVNEKKISPEKQFTCNSVYKSSNNKYLFLKHHFTTWMYKANLIKSLNIHFDEDLSIGEDRLFLARCQVFSETISTCEEVVYHYYRSLTGTVMGEWTVEKQMSSLEFLRRFKIIHNNSTISKLFLIKNIPWHTYLLQKSANTFSSDQFFKILTKYNEILNPKALVSDLDIAVVREFKNLNEYQLKLFNLLLNNKVANAFNHLLG